jgi:hypothetical protein
MRRDGGAKEAFHSRNVMRALAGEGMGELVLAGEEGPLAYTLLRNASGR